MSWWKSLPTESKTSIAVALIAGIITLLTALITAFLTPGNRSTLPNSNSEEIVSLQNQIGEINNRIKQINDEILNLPQGSSQVTATLQFERIQALLGEVEGKVGNLERIIIEDPNRAIELPLLRKDLESVQAVYNSRLASLEQSVNQIYTVIIGVLVVIGLGFLGVAASNFFTTKSK